MKAPSNAVAPPAIHAPIISFRVDVQEATIAGVTKIPEPTIPPITTMVESKKPMRRASRSSGTRTLYHAQARLAETPLRPAVASWRIPFIPIPAGEPGAHGRTDWLPRGGPFPPPARPGAGNGPRSARLLRRIVWHGGDGISALQHRWRRPVQVPDEAMQARFSRRGTGRADPPARDVSLILRRVGGVGAREPAHEGSLDIENLDS